MRTHRRVLAGVIGLAVAVTAASGGGEDLSGLDRGHRLLIEHGFQLVALVDADLTSSENWRTSRFTTMMFSDHYASRDQTGTQRGQDLTQFPHAAWGRLTWSQEMSSASLRDILTAPEKPHLARLTMLQYLDEQLINRPEVVEDAKIVLADWRARYPRAISFTNQVGGVWKPAVLRNYIETAQPDMLYFDRYVFKGLSADTPEDEQRRRHYLVLQRTRQAALAGHAGSGNRPIPYGIYTQNTLIPRNDHVASASETCFQYFTALAFGCKSIAAFTYARDVRIDGLESYMFRGANDPERPNDTDPLPLFFVFAECNRQTLNLAPALVRLLSTDIRIVRGRKSDGELNSLTDTRVGEWSADADLCIAAIAARNVGTRNAGQPGDVVIGYFTPLLRGFDGDRDTYFMVVNGLTHPEGSESDTAQTITMTFDFQKSGITSLERLNRDSGRVEVIDEPSEGWTHVGGSVYQLESTLPGGTGDLFKFKTGATFLAGRTGKP